MNKYVKANIFVTDSEDFNGVYVRDISPEDIEEGQEFGIGAEVRIRVGVMSSQTAVGKIIGFPGLISDKNDN